MGEELNKQISGEETPCNIGDYTDKNSLARKLLDQIDNIKDKMAFLTGTLESYEMADGTLEGMELSGMKLICDRMTDELALAHEFICDADFHREAPETDLPEASPVRSARG